MPDVTQEKIAVVRALRNWEIRDLIYLILSFKETVDGQIGHVVYRTFEQELGEANKKAEEERDSGSAPSDCLH